jgi:hypothetical protein
VCRRVAFYVGCEFEVRMGKSIACEALTFMSYELGFVEIDLLDESCSVSS